jgi:hypothetical protein
MSDFCDFVPDDPSCQTAPEPVDVVDNGGDGDTAGMVDGGDMKMDKGDHDDGEMTWAKFDEKAGEYFHPMDGNLAYLGVVVGAVVEAVMHGFVWHDDNSDTYSQAASGASNTDYYSLLHKIEVFGSLGVYGIASITQLLATFGIMVGINLMVWDLVLPLGGMVL